MWPKVLAAHFRDQPASQETKPASFASEGAQPARRPSQPASQPSRRHMKCLIKLDTSNSLVAGAPSCPGLVHCWALLGEQCQDDCWPLLGKLPSSQFAGFKELISIQHADIHSGCVPAMNKQTHTHKQTNKQLIKQSNNKTIKQ